MAPEDPSDGERASTDKSMASKAFARVLRATRIEPATGIRAQKEPFQGRQKQLVETNEEGRRSGWFS